MLSDGDLSFYANILYISDLEILTVVQKIHEKQIGIKPEHINKHDTFKDEINMCDTYGCNVENVDKTIYSFKFSSFQAFLGFIQRYNIRLP